jgi:GH35 family endo-1,4-beta-xylanase
MQMEFTQPEYETWYLDDVNKVYNFALDNDLDFHGTSHYWHIHQPRWLSVVLPTLGDEARAKILLDRITKLSEYSGTFDIVNEGYSVKPFTQSIWTSFLKADIIGQLITYGLNTFPERAFYNAGLFKDENGLYEIERIKELSDAGLKNFGLQFHLTATTYHLEVWEEFKPHIEDLLIYLRNKNCNVRFSEIGIYHNYDELGDDLQAHLWKEVAGLALKFRDIVSVFLMWGIKDPAWRKNTTLFYSDGTPKKSFYELLKFLKEYNG